MVKRLISIALLVFLCTFASAQSTVSRWDLGAAGSAGVVTVIGSGSSYILTLPNVSFALCAYPAITSGANTPCTNLVITYTNKTGTTPCPSNAQIVLQLSTTCQATSDVYGAIGVYVAAGTYAYTLTANGVTFGPYTVDIGASGSGGGGGGGGGGSGCITNPADSGCALLGNPSIDQFIGTTVGPGTGWISQLTASGVTFKVPGQFIGGGPTNGLNFPDSGANCVNGLDNSALVCSGTPPGSSVLDPGSSYRPIFSAKHSGVAYNSELQTKAEYNLANGYAPLDSGALIPIANFVTDPSACNASSFIKGDRSGCAGSSATPSFSSLTSGTNTTMVAVCGAGCSIQPTGSGIINANFIASNTFNAQASAANQTFVSVGIGNLSPVALPSCTGANNALQFNTSAHTFPCVTVASGVPLTEFACTGTAGACPNATEYTGDAADQILAQITVAGGQLTSGKCIHAIAWIQHSTGTASVTYRWNVGGTGAVNTDVTGGTSGTNQSSTSAAAYIEAQMDVCAYSSTAVYLRTHALQTGGTQVAGGFTNAISVTLSSSFTINLLFNVAATDKVTFNGGYLNFP